MTLAVDAPVYDAVADDGIFVDWHRLMNEFSKLVQIRQVFKGYTISLCLL
jgi:hypothetical protein